LAGGKAEHEIADMDFERMTWRCALIKVHEERNPDQCRQPSRGFSFTTTSFLTVVSFQ
jgi:hypothetical protein